MKYMLSLLVLVCAGCASMTGHQPISINDARDGAVVLRVLNNGKASPDTWGYGLGAWGDVTIVEVAKKKNSDEKIHLAPLSAFGSNAAHTQVFAGTLPPGTYQLDSLNQTRTAIVYVATFRDSTDLKFKGDFGTFEIRSGQITDLGTVVHSWVSTAMFVQKPTQVITSHDDASNNPDTAAIIRDAAPALSNLLSNPLLSWSKNSASPDVQTNYKTLLENSPGVTLPQETEKGSFLYGTVNGVVYNWTPGQKRIPLDIGIRRAIDAVLIADNGLWFVAGEFGVIKVSDDHGRSWKSIQGNLPFGHIVNLIQWQTKLIATIYHRDSVAVYSSPIGNAGQWKELITYQLDAENMFTNPRKGGRPQSLLIKNSLFIILPANKMVRFDLATDKSEIVQYPGLVPIRISASPDGVLRCRSATMTFHKLYASDDLGKTWLETETSMHTLDPVFRDKNTGIAYSYSDNKVQMLSTNDGGTSWQRTEKLLVFPNRMFYAKDGKTAYIASNSGEFWQTKDDGKTWTLVTNN